VSNPGISAARLDVVSKTLQLRGFSAIDSSIKSGRCACKGWPAQFCNFGHVVNQAGSLVAHFGVGGKVAAAAADSC
jgi:hypothetical protein